MGLRGAHSARAVAVLTISLIVLGCSERHQGAEEWMGPCDGTPTGAVYPIRQTDPAWSRTGLIAYHDNGVACVGTRGAATVDTALAGLWILNPADGSTRRLLSTGYGPAWSPDGRVLAFEAGFQIFRINVDGTGLQRLTFGGQNFYPAWSPDGTSIVYDSNAPGPPQPFALWIMGPDGSGKRRLCARSAFDDRLADWNPDGIRILHSFADSLDTSPEIYVTDTTDCVSVALTKNEAFDLHAKYSPDGSRIVFQSQRYGHYPPELWIMGSDGAGLHQVTHGGGTLPSWSTDGLRIVYLRENQFRSCPEVNTLWILDLATGSQSPALPLTVATCP